MPAADNDAQDLLGFLFAEYQESLVEAKTPLNEIEQGIVDRFIKFGQERLRTLSPQGLTYTEAGMAVKMADGTELSFLPAIEFRDVSAIHGVQVMQGGGTTRGGQNSTVQMGDFPVTGPRDRRHDRATGKG